MNSRRTVLVVALFVPLVVVVASTPAWPTDAAQCGGEEQAPCSITDPSFWTSGGLFCRPGIAATGPFRVLPDDIECRVEDLVEFRAALEQLVRLMNEDFVNLAQALATLDLHDFLTEQCLGQVVDGECWTTPPSSVAGFSHPVHTLGVCVPLVDICNDLPIGVTCTANCTISVPGVPGVVVPLPDLTAPGWAVPGQLAGFIADLAGTLTQLHDSAPECLDDVLTTIGTLPQLPELPSDPGSFDLDAFLTALSSLQQYLEGDVFQRLLDLAADFTDPPGTCRSVFRRGDLNRDAVVNLRDAILVLLTLLLGDETPICMKAADVDDNGRVNIVDLVFIVRFVFVSGDPPASPFPGCGRDPTVDDLTCVAFASCV